MKDPHLVDKTMMLFHTVPLLQLTQKAAWHTGASLHIII